MTLVYIYTDFESAWNIECAVVDTIAEAAEILYDTQTYPHRAFLFSDKPLYDKWDHDNELVREYRKLYDKDVEQGERETLRRLKEKYKDG